MRRALAQAYAGVLLGTEPFIERHRHLVDDRHANPCVPKRRITLPEITAAVVTTFQVQPELLTISGRHGNAPRDAAIWLSRELTTHSLDEVASAFGGVTRSAVTDAVRRCDHRQQSTPSFRSLCAAARQLALNAGSGVRISEIAADDFPTSQTVPGDF